MEIKISLNKVIILVPKAGTEPVLLLKNDEEEAWQVFIYAVCYTVNTPFL